MKKFLSIGLTVIILFTLSVASFAYSDNASYGSVPKAYEDLKIDAVKDEMYEKGLQIDLIRVNTGEDVFATAKTWYLWADGWIYVFMEVLDSDIVEPDPDKQQNAPWETDSVEVFIDEGNDAEELQQYRIDVTGWPSYYTQDGDADYGPDAVKDRFAYAAKRVTGGYNLEFKVPTKSAKGQQVGLNMQINDVRDDGGSQVIVYPKNSLDSGGSWDGDTFDYIVLGEALEKPTIKEDAPAETTADKNPKTSDATAIYLSLALLSSAAFLVIKRKKA